ncbi:MAG: TRL-like family protein [Planctomycetota bacterium]
MKKIFTMCVLMAAAALLTNGCFVASAAPTNGVFYTKVNGPLALGDQSVLPSKVGKASTKGIIGFASGDCSISAAMQDGAITKVHHIDHETTNILGLVSSFTTVVYGE